MALAIYIIAHKASVKGRGEAIIQKAELEAENIKQQKILQAKEKFVQLKSEHEDYISNKNKQLQERENAIHQKESQLGQQASELGRKQHEIDSARGQVRAQMENLERKQEECDKLVAQVNKQLETIAGMTAVEAKNMLVENLKAEARTEAQAYINDTMDDARLNAAKEAKRIVINTIQRTATETAIENADRKSVV